MIDIQALISWLGVDGAKCGLEKSELTNAELVEIFSKYFPKGPGKLKRIEIIDEIISSSRKELYKSPDELIEMSQDELRQYFNVTKLSRDELIELLNVLEIRPGSIAKKSLINFAVREISDIGMYRRVAKGHSHSE